MNNIEARAAFDRAVNQVETGTTFLNRFLGLRIVPGGDATVVEFDVQDIFCNRRGVVHGGIVAFIFDVAMGNHHRKALGSGVTVEMKVQYVRAATQGTLRCEARFLKKGKRISFIEARLSEPSGELVAAATSTWHRAED